MRRIDTDAINKLVEVIVCATEDGRWIDVTTGLPGVGSDDPSNEASRAVTRQRFEQAKRAVERFAEALGAAPSADAGDPQPLVTSSLAELRAEPSPVVSITVNMSNAPYHDVAGKIAGALTELLRASGETG